MLLLRLGQGSGMGQGMRFTCSFFFYPVQDKGVCHFKWRGKKNVENETHSLTQALTLTLTLYIRPQATSDDHAHCSI